MDWPGGVIKEIRKSGVKVVLVRDPDRLLLEEHLLERSRMRALMCWIKDPVYPPCLGSPISPYQQETVGSPGNQSFEDVPFDIYQGALLFDLSLASQFELLDQE